MSRFALLSAVAVLALGATVARAETVDEKIKKMIADKTVTINVQDHTRDACDRANNITITSTTDGDVVLKPGEEKYFKINKDKDDYTRSGGWYWKCGNSEERARIRGASTIKAIRKENGVVDWYWVTLEVK